MHCVTNGSDLSACLANCIFIRTLCTRSSPAGAEINPNIARAKCSKPLQQNEITQSVYYTPLPSSIAVTVMEEGREVSANIFYFDNCRDLARLQEILLKRCCIVGHDLKRELIMLWRHGLKVENPVLFDVMIAASCIHMGRQKTADRYTEGEFKSNPDRVIRNQDGKRNEWVRFLGLQNLEKINCSPNSGRGFSSNGSFSFASPEHKPEMRELRLLQRIHKRILAKVAEKGLQEYLSTVEMPFIYVLALAEYRGMRVNANQHKYCLKLYARIIDKYKKNLARAGIGKPQSQEAFDKYVRDHDLLHLFPKKSKSGLVSQKLKLLKKASKQDPIINDIYHYRHYSRIRNNLQRWFSNRDSNGRVHAFFHQNASYTGRTSILKPDLGGVEGSAQALAIPDDDKVFCELDIHGCDAAFAAAYFEEKKLFDMYHLADNLFEEIAAKVYGGKFTAKDIKDIFYPLLYCGDEHTVAKELGIDTKEALVRIQQFYEAFPGLDQARQRYADKCLDEESAPIALGLRRYIDTSDKDKQRLRRSIINTPVQGLGSIALKLAANAFIAQTPRAEVNLILTKHDSFLFECPADKLEFYRNIAINCIINAGRHLFPELTLKVSTNKSESYTWGTLASYENEILKAQKIDKQDS